MSHAMTAMTLGQVLFLDVEFGRKRSRTLCLKRQRHEGRARFKLYLQSKCLERTKAVAVVVVLRDLDEAFRHRMVLLFTLGIGATTLWKDG